MHRNRLTQTFTAALLLLGASAFNPRNAQAHCEVPCGIYANQLRFESMLEDQKTIAKANEEMAKHLADMADKPTALTVNQLARWVTTKEEHATRIQQTIAQYFMTQRIKPGTDDATQQDYVKKLTAAHAVMQAAMKSKQDPTPEIASALRDTILDFYRAYEGKEPEFE